MLSLKYTVREAHQVARLLCEHGFMFDVAHTSVPRRAIRALWIVLDDRDVTWIPVRSDWRLNERHYGALEGLDKGEVARARAASGQGNRTAVATAAFAATEPSVAITT